MHAYVITAATLYVIIFVPIYTETWNIQATTGDKPPALCGHTLTIMDGNKALLFAGVDDKNHWHNQSYLLDMEKWV